MLADVGEEELQAVAGAADMRRCLRGSGLGFLLRLLLLLRLRDRGRRRDLQPDALELRGQILGVLVVEVQLEGQALARLAALRELQTAAA